MSRLKLLLISGLLTLGVAAILVAVTRERPRDIATVPERSVSVNAGRARQAVVLDDRRQQLAGIRTEPVRHATLMRTVRGTGAVVINETTVTDVNLKLDGWIRDLFVNYTGQEVTKGQPLFTLYSQELIGAQLQYLAALRSLQQLTPAQAADREYQERLIETPRQRLLYWDVPQDQIKALEEAGRALEAVTFRSPAAGVVIEKAATKGMHVESGATLYKLADTSVMWIEAAFNVRDGTQLRQGQRAAITIDPQRAEKLTGRIVDIYPILSEPSRSVRVRLEVANRRGDLKAGMFATVEVAVEPTEGLLVSEDAVIDSGRQQTVFVATGNGRFEPRTVTTGARADNQIVVLSGLREGEQVVSRGTFLLDSESQLRAALEGYSSSTSTSQSSDKRPQSTLNVSMDPDPARVGENHVRVEMLDAHNMPVTDASVVVRFYMAPMPSMNMPAMRAEARLQHTGSGIYLGGGTLPMAGPWEATVSASRNGQPIGEKRVSFVVR